jgi:hypothetical protein
VNKIPLLIVLALIAMPYVHIQAQMKAGGTEAAKYNNYDSISTDAAGRVLETIHTFFQGNEYCIRLTGDTMTGLVVDSIQIPTGKYALYQKKIDDIRTQRAKDRKEEAAAAGTDGKGSADPDKKMMHCMMDDLVTDGIIKTRDSLFSLSLSAAGMTVNGKPQPAVVYTRYKERYPAWAATGFTYGGNLEWYQGVHIKKEN